MQPAARSSDLTMLGALLTVGGAAALCLSSQLSVDEPPDLHAGPPNGGVADVREAAQPEFSHHGGSLLLMAGVVLILVLGWVLLSRPNRAWWLVVFAAMASGWIALLEFDPTFRTVYPVGSNGLPNRAATPIVISLGTAGLTALAGAAASLTGSAIMVRSARR